ncbi:MAG: acetolactate synthase large subunit [Betaproteobacteria bacterium]|nr:acetolactate synthase large subunit [Betaproteobacteria bacterium]
MLGAEILVRSLVAGGIDTCLGNPGTSEMHFIAALDRVPGMRGVLVLFEGVATGAADGYARMAGKPACTLMHLGPGLANGLCNLHNARRARVPIVNIVGEHAAHHRMHDAPLHSDVEGIARPFSAWLRTARSAATLAQDCAEAIAAARTPPGRIATLVLPADTAWTDGGDFVAVAIEAARPERVPAAHVESIARHLRESRASALMIGGEGLSRRGIAAAHAIAGATGCRVFAPMSNARMYRGWGCHPVERVPFGVDEAMAFLAGLESVVLAGAVPPVAFFAYPDKPSLLAPPGCEMTTLAEPAHDVLAALEDLAAALGAKPVAPPRMNPASAPESGQLTAQALAAIVASALREDTIVVDESLSLGFTLYPAMAAAAPHDWLQMAGGATGEGLPLAVGAALACPRRKVVCLQADGSGLYTCQALWTMAREGLDVTSVILSNRAYATLIGELAKVGASNPGANALRMIGLDSPAVGWPEIARGFGVPGERATDAAEFSRALARALATHGPNLIEAVLA